MKKGQILHMRRLDQMMSKILEYPLTVISAPMGYGKTTNLKNFFEKNQIEALWTSLYGLDGDEVILWNKIFSAVVRQYPGVGERIKWIGFPDEEGRIKDVIQSIKTIEDEVISVIVLDDYPFLEETPNTLKIIENIAKEQIPGFHIVLLSRSKPHLNYHELIAKKFCHYMDAQNLSLNKEEIKEYFSMLALEITETQVQTIFDYTKGWISAIYLIYMGMKENVPMNRILRMNELIRDNLLIYFNNEEKILLMKLGFLDHFTKEAAAEILETKQVYSVLDNMLSNNAFIDLDASTGRFKILGILLDFLATERIHYNIDEKEICHRAGQYFLKQHDIITAFNYYQKCDAIVEFLYDTIKIPDIDISKIDIDSLYEIYTNISEDMYKKYPLFSLHIASKFILSGNSSLMEKGARIKDILSYALETEINMMKEMEDRIFGEIDLLNMFLAFNDTKKMALAAQNTKRLLKYPIHNLISRKIVITFGLPYFIYQYHKNAGDILSIIKDIQQGFPPENPCQFYLGCGELAFAEYSLEILDEKNAEEYALQAIQKVEALNETGIILCANFNLMRLQLLKGNLKKANQILLNTKMYLRKKECHMNDQTRRIYATTMDLFSGYMYGCMMKKDEIPLFLSMGELEKGTYLMKGMGFPNIIYGKYLMLSKQWQQLEIQCKSFERDYLAFHNLIGLIINGVYSAIAKWNLYGEKPGAETLIPILLDAQKDNLQLIIVENAGFVLPILKYIAKEIESKSSWISEKPDILYINRLLKAAKKYESNLKKQLAMIHLTSREKQVLQLIAKGRTRAEISAELSISVSSVKKHLENIFMKLNVNNKVLAIKKAKEERLI